MEYSRPQYWSGSPSPSSGDLPNHSLIMIYVLSLNVPNSPPVVPNNPPTGGYYYLCFIDEGTNAQRESHWAKARQLKSRKPGFEPQSVTLALTHHLMTTCGA